MSGAPEAVRARLLALQDEKNAPFMAKLVPTLPPESVLGVRMPDCRSLARELCREPDIGLFSQICRTGIWTRTTSTR